MISASAARGLRGITLPTRALRREGISRLRRVPGDQFCHSNSALRRILKSGRGRFRRSEAMLSNSPISARAFGCEASGSPDSSDSAGVASIWLMAWSSSSKIVGLFMIAPHITAQGLQGAKLKLLYGPFRAPQLLRNLPQAFLLHKPAEDHQALVFGKALDKLKHHGAPFNFMVRAGLFQILRRDLLVLRFSLPAVGQRIRGNPQEPRHERNAPPLEAPQLGKRLVEDLRSHVFRFLAVLYPSRNKRVDTGKVVLIQLRKAAWVMLGRLDQEPFAGCIGYIGNNVQDRSPRGIIFILST